MTHRLEAPLKSLLQDPIDQSRLARMRRRVAATRRMPPRTRRWAPWVAVAALLPIAGTVAWWINASSVTAVRGAIALNGGAAFTGADGPREVRLEDGSRLYLEDGARIEVIASDGDQVLLAQSDGRVTYDIHPGGPRRWSIDAGALGIDVLGTRFAIERRGQHARVDVTRGRVRARSASALRTLGAGESMVAGEQPETTIAAVVQPTNLVAAPAHAAPAVEPVAPRVLAPRARVAPAPPAPVEPSWRGLSEQGLHREAFDVIGEDGWQAETEHAQSVEELFALADTARLSGHAAAARAPLRRIMNDFPGDARAGVAALTLGRLDLDTLRAPDEAVDALQAALRLGVAPRLRDTARARLAEAYQRAGRSAEARQAAQRYLDEQPQGLHARAMRELLSQ